jgi:hypothetical protein
MDLHALLHKLIDKAGVGENEGERQAWHAAVDRDFADPPAPTDPRDIELAELRAKLASKQIAEDTDPKDAELAELRAQAAAAADDAASSPA